MSATYQSLEVKMSNAYLTKKFNKIYQGNSGVNKNVEEVINVYLGNDSNGANSKELRRLKDREAKGAETLKTVYSNASPEVKAALDQIKNVFSAYSEKQAKLNDVKRSKTLGGQIENWQKRYSPEVAAELNDLSMAYQGRANDGRRSLKLRSFDKRYEEANKVIGSLANNSLSEESKPAIKELSNIFIGYEEKHELKEVAGAFRGGGNVRPISVRSPLRSENQKLVSSLDDLVVNNSVDPTQNAYPVQPGKKSFMQYLQNAARKPIGKVASIAIGILAVGGLTYSSMHLAGCGKAGENKTKTEQTTDNNIGTPEFIKVKGAEAVELRLRDAAKTTPNISAIELRISELISGEESIIQASETEETNDEAKEPEYKTVIPSGVDTNIIDPETAYFTSSVNKDEAAVDYAQPKDLPKGPSAQYQTPEAPKDKPEVQEAPKLEPKVPESSPATKDVAPQPDYMHGGQGAIPNPQGAAPKAEPDSRISEVEKQLDYIIGGDGIVPPAPELNPELKPSPKPSELEQQLDYLAGGEGAIPHPKEPTYEERINAKILDLEKQIGDMLSGKGAVPPAKAMPTPAVPPTKAMPTPKASGYEAPSKAPAVKQCLDWTESDLEKGIREYKFNTNGKFKAKLNKDLTKVVKEEGGTVVARLLLPTKDGKNKVYETSIIGQKGEIEIDTGNNYQKNFQLGVGRISLGPNGEKCVEYLASISRGVKVAEAVPAESKVTPPEAAPTPPKEKVEVKITKKFEIAKVPGGEEVKKPTEAPKEDKNKGLRITDEKKQEQPPVQAIQERLPEIPLNITTIDMLNKKAWGLGGKYGYVISETKVERGNQLYSVFVDKIKQKDPSYMFIKTTPKVSNAEAAVPNLTIEFSKNKEEKMFREVTPEKDATTLDKVILMNFNNDKRAKTAYDKVIELEGTPEEKAAQAAMETTKQLREMRKQGDFNTHWFDRDVKSADPSAEPSIQGHVFTNTGFENNFGAIFTTGGLDVGRVEESNWGDFKVGKEIQNPRGGTSDGGGGPSAPSGGGAGPGGPGGTL